MLTQAQIFERISMLDKHQYKSIERFLVCYTCGDWTASGMFEQGRKIRKLFRKIQKYIIKCEGSVNVAAVVFVLDNAARFLFMNRCEKTQEGAKKALNKVLNCGGW